MQLNKKDRVESQELLQKIRFGACSKGSLYDILRIRMILRLAFISVLWASLPLFGWGGPTHPSEYGFTWKTERDILTLTNSCIDDFSWSTAVVGQPDLKVVPLYGWSKNSDNEYVFTFYFEDQDSCWEEREVGGSAGKIPCPGPAAKNPGNVENTKHVVRAFRDRLTDKYFHFEYVREEITWLPSSSLRTTWLKQSADRKGDFEGDCYLTQAQSNIEAAARRTAFPKLGYSINGNQVTVTFNTLTRTESVRLSRGLVLSTVTISDLQFLYLRDAVESIPDLASDHDPWFNGFLIFPYPAGDWVMHEIAYSPEIWVDTSGVHKTCPQPF
jgi:hypothetical protein